MHASRLLHNHIENSCPHINIATLGRLMKVSNTLLNGGKLSLTNLGRNISGTAKVKHKIKAIDRLLANKRLYSERKDIYKALAVKMIGAKQKVEIIVDWSPCGNREQQMLRASYYYKGHSKVLYEEVHPETTNKGHRYIHKMFLKRLKTLLPDIREVIIVTDAGFKTDWFKQVLDLGWHFNGRVRGNIYYSKEGQPWKKVVSLYKKATQTPCFIGNILLGKKSKLASCLYLYKDKKAKAKKKNKRKIKKLSSRNSKKYHKAEDTAARKKGRDPWVIVSSLPHTSSRGKQVIATYGARMKIEHEFRSVKNIQLGIGLDLARSRSEKRLEMLLLIGAIAMYMLWLIGLVAESKSLQFDFQANTVTKHRVLSLQYLGMQIMKHSSKSLTLYDFTQILNSY